MATNDYISSVEMNANLAGLFFRDIGEKIDINMFNKKKKDDKLIKLSTHKQIIDLMEHLGFDKKGFSGYKPPQNGISKGQMKLFFGDIFSRLQQIQKKLFDEKSTVLTRFKLEISKISNESLKAKLEETIKLEGVAKLQISLKEIRKEERKNVSGVSKNKDILRQLQKILETCKLEEFESSFKLLNDNLESIKTIIDIDINNTDKLSSKILDFIIVKKKDYEFCAAVEYKPKENKFFSCDTAKKTNTKELYPWQKNVINSIVDEGKSIIVRGPTNGGKTFVGLSVIDHFISRSANFAFIVPTTYLAAQTYSNIINTFGSRCTVNLFAGSLYVSSSTCPNVIVGTPEPVWAWLRNHPNFYFQRMIIDEIHTISSSNLSLGFAIRNIIARCKTQFLGLSATIHDEDLISLTELVKLNGIDCEYLKYDDRPIPLVNQRFTGNGLSLVKGPQNKSLIPEINPRNTLNLIRIIKNKDQLPCLIFDESDSSSWNQFVQFNEYLSYLDTEISPEWAKLKEGIDLNIERYNSIHSSGYQEYCNVYNDGNQKKLSMLSSNYKLMASERSKLVKTSFDLCLSVTKEAVKKVLNTDFDEYKVLVDDSLKTRFRSVNIQVKEESVYPGAIDLLKSLELLKETKDYTPRRQLDSIEPLGLYFDGVSPWIRFSDKTTSNNLSQMLRSDRKTDQREHMIKMCAAESIKESDVEDIFKILEKGARYGIVSLLPSLPNVIQIEILKLFNCKAINIVFTSRDMSMGVNFPVVTSIVRCTSSKQSIPVDARIQAEGRAGRKGKSDYGYSISWNIMNDYIKEFSRLNIPKLDEKKGCYINNIDKTIESLYTHYICNKDINNYFEKISEKLFKVVVNKKKILSEADIELIEMRDREIGDEMDIAEVSANSKVVKLKTLTPMTQRVVEKNVNEVWKATCIDLIEKLEESLDNCFHKARVVGNFLCDSVIKGTYVKLDAERDLVKEIEVHDKIIAEKILRKAIKVTPCDDEEYLETLKSILEIETDFIEDSDLIDSIMSAYECLQETDLYKEIIDKRIIIYRMIELIDVYINALQELINYPQKNISRVLISKNEIFMKMTSAEQIESVKMFKKHLTEMFRGICQAKYRCMKHLK